jgi:mannose-1-phosphate guanylyltransferase
VCTSLGISHMTVTAGDEGSAIDVLLALLHLEASLTDAAPVLFIPGDQVVEEETVVSRALVEMSRWIVRASDVVYLLGTHARGPHNELGYIVPWLADYSGPAGVYEFIERPPLEVARRLIREGALWNTFIFGGALPTLLTLYQSRFPAETSALRMSLRRSGPAGDRSATEESCGRLRSADFSQHIVASQLEKLRVLRLADCGWWPLKPPSGPTLERRIAPGHSPRP